MADDPRVAGVRFRNAGKIFYFHTAGMRLEPGEYVVVETMRGPEIAKVVIAPDQVVVNELGREDLKPILRLATEANLRKADALRRKAEGLLPEARRLGEELRFPAHIDNAEFTLDGRRLTLSFTSEERLDYRDFVRRASQRFQTHVEMRQIGARDRAKLAGGYGVCGRELCCSSWLTTFPSISIRMAKEQELPLNPQKISGLCGRLLCCLSYEEDGYKEMRKSLPKIGQRCSTPTGEGRVIDLNILRRQVTLLVEGQRMEVPDRDLGTVVRWDTSSKSAPPPPSISRADAIAQGLIEATEEDLREPEPDWDAPTGVIEAGRGRLPGGGPRKVIAERPPRAPGTSSRPGQRPPREESAGDSRGGQRGQQSAPQPSGRGQQQPRRPQGQRPPAPEGLPEGRIFRRGAGPGADAASGPDSTPPAEGSGQRGRRRRPRGGRPPGGPTAGGD